MTMKIFLLTLVRDAIPDSNSAVVVNTVKKRYTIVPLKILFYINVNFMSKGLYEIKTIILNMSFTPFPPHFEQCYKNWRIGRRWLP